MADCLSQVSKRRDSDQQPREMRRSCRFLIWRHSTCDCAKSQMVGKWLLQVLDPAVQNVHSARVNSTRECLLLSNASLRLADLPNSPLLETMFDQLVQAISTSRPKELPLYLQNKHAPVDFVIRSLQPILNCRMFLFIVFSLQNLNKKQVANIYC